MKSNSAALGFRAHSGWAVVVAVSGTADRPTILDRRRIVTADALLPGSRQPYHAAQPLAIEAAETWLRQCRESSARLAVEAVSTLVTQLTGDGFTVSGAGILYASGRPLPDLDAILRSHALIHTAEGEFFRDVLVHAAGHCKLPVTKIKERDIWDQQRKLDAIGKSLGPPWRQDEKLAALAACRAL